MIATPEQTAKETAAHQDRLARLESLIYGKQGFLGILSQLIELTKTFSSIAVLPPDQIQSITEKVTKALEEQFPPASADLSVEDRLTRLESALLGSAEMEGIASATAYLQSHVGTLKPLPSGRD